MKLTMLLERLGWLAMKKAKKIILKKFKIKHTGVVYVETKENLICVFNQGEKINLLLKFFKNLKKSLQDHLVVCHLVLFDLPETLRKVVESELRFFLA